MKFKPGDKVWVVCCNAIYNVHGTKAGVILGAAAPFPFWEAPPGPHPGAGDWYEVLVPESPNPVYIHWVSRDDYMFPRYDDGRESSNWDVGVWRPSCMPADVENFSCVTVPIMERDT
jgi:hypothetical protein